ncbi:MAG: PorT family protein [Chitinophagales bacterium]|nr:PorT family protein [Chitinophagales bacterium]
MKKIILILMFVFPVLVNAQSGMTAQQQEEFKKQMEQFKIDMDRQMQLLKDSLNQLNAQMKNEDWSAFDTSSFDADAEPPMEEYPGGIDIGANNDSTEVHVGKWNIIVHEGDDGEEDHVQIYKSDQENNYEDDYKEPANLVTKFLQLDIGLNNYFAKDFNSKLPAQYQPMEPIPGKSWVVNIHAFDQRVNLIDHHLWFAYGVYFELNSYKYNTDEVLIPKIDSVDFYTSDSPIKKNKLSSEYIGIPVTFRFESNPDNFSKSFHISAGGFGEYLIGAHTKTKSTSNDKAKAHDDFNLNRFRYGVTTRLGYGWANLFVNYSLSELLQDGTGPVVYPFSAGLALEF